MLGLRERHRRVHACTYTATKYACAVNQGAALSCHAAQPITAFLRTVHRMQRVCLYQDKRWASTTVRECTLTLQHFRGIICSANLKLEVIGKKKRRGLRRKTSECTQHFFRTLRACAAHRRARQCGPPLLHPGAISQQQEAYPASAATRWGNKGVCFCLFCVPAYACPTSPYMTFTRPRTLE